VEQGILALDTQKGVISTDSEKDWAGCKKAAILFNLSLFSGVFP
jgi:hypothetical protein